MSPPAASLFMQQIGVGISSTSVVREKNIRKAVEFVAARTKYWACAFGTEDGSVCKVIAMYADKLMVYDPYGISSTGQHPRSGGTDPPYTVKRKQTPLDDELVLDEDTLRWYEKASHQREKAIDEAKPGFDRRL